MNFNSISDDIEQSKLYSKQSKTILKFRISKHVSNANILSTSAHVRLDYACEALYVIFTLNYIKLINTLLIVLRLALPFPEQRSLSPDLILKGRYAGHGF